MIAEPLDGPSTRRAGRRWFDDFCNFGLAVVALGGLAGCQSSGAKIDRASLDANQDVVAVKSSNPFTFYQLMQDPKAGGEVRIEAKLTFPPNAPKGQKLPAVIFVHGSGGPQPRHRKWLNLMRDMGITTVYANHFAPRGESSTVGD